MNTVTTGGAALGIGLLLLRGGLWWPGLRRLQKDWRTVLTLVPGLYAFLYGVLAVVCVGGLLGAAADFALWGANWVGDTVLVIGVGGEARYEVSQGTASTLTNGGSAMVLILSFGFVVLLNRSKTSRGELWQWCLAGLLLAFTPGVAGKVAPPLSSLVNVAGVWLGTDVIT